MPESPIGLLYSARAQILILTMRVFKGRSKRRVRRSRNSMVVAGAKHGSLESVMSFFVICSVVNLAKTPKMQVLRRAREKVDASL